MPIYHAGRMLSSRFTKVNGMPQSAYQLPPKRTGGCYRTQATTPWLVPAAHFHPAQEVRRRLVGIGGARCEYALT